MAINFYLRIFGRTGSSLPCSGFSLRKPCLFQGTGSRCAGSAVGALGLVAPQHEESYWIRDQTHVLCNARRILIHWATREALESAFYHLKILNAFYHLHFSSSNNLHNLTLFQEYQSKYLPKQIMDFGGFCLTELPLWVSLLVTVQFSRAVFSRIIREAVINSHGPGTTGLDLS